MYFSFNIDIRKLISNILPVYVLKNLFKYFYMVSLLSFC